MRRQCFRLALLSLTVVAAACTRHAPGGPADLQPLGDIARAVLAGSEDYSLPSLYCQLLDIETLEGSDCSFAMRVFQAGDELRGFNVAPATYNEEFPIVVTRAVEDRLYLYRTNGQGLLLKAVRAVESAEPRVVENGEAAKAFEDEMRFWHSKEGDIQKGATR
jgi:hypothetical protein